MGKPPVSILARDRRERFSDGEIQALQCSRRLRLQECIDLGPTLFNWEEVMRIRQQIKGTDAGLRLH